MLGSGFSGILASRLGMGLALGFMVIVAWIRRPTVSHSRDVKEAMSSLPKSVDFVQSNQESKSNQWGLIVPLIGILSFATNSNSLSNAIFNFAHLSEVIRTTGDNWFSWTLWVDRWRQGSSSQRMLYSLLVFAMVLQYLRILYGESYTVRQNVFVEDEQEIVDTPDILSTIPTKEQELEQKIADLVDSNSRLAHKCQSLRLASVSRRNVIPVTPLPSSSDEEVVFDPKESDVIYLRNQKRRFREFLEEEDRALFDAHFDDTHWDEVDWNSDNADELLDYMGQFVQNRKPIHGLRESVSDQKVKEQFMFNEMDMQKLKICIHDNRTCNIVRPESATGAPTLYVPKTWVIHHSGEWRGQAVRYQGGWLTASHVVEDPEQKVIPENCTLDGHSFEVQHLGNDIAYLRCKTLKLTPAISVAKETSDLIGRKVAIVWQNVAQENCVSVGTITQISGKKVFYNFATRHGCSGGLVLLLPDKPGNTAKFLAIHQSGFDAVRQNQGYLISDLNISKN
jgi:hypothetical protein